MAGAEQVGGAAADPGLLPEAAESLLDYLCGCRYPIGVDHHLRLQRLLASLAARGELPASSRDLELWVRPLVCQSAREQERFGRDFEDWLRIRGEAVVESAPVSEPVTKTLREVKRGRETFVRIGLAGFATVTVIGSVWHFYGHRVRAYFLRTRPREPQSPSPTLPNVVYLELALAIAFVAALVFAFVLWRRGRLGAFLVQHERQGPSSTSALFVERADGLIFDTRLLAIAARGFGIYRRLPSEALDIAASAAATAQEAGRFTPVFAERPAVPEYLVLIDRSSTADLFAAYASGIVRSLDESNVAVDQFYFDRIPQQCYAQRGHTPVGIRELTERFPDHRVIVFSDGAGFLETTSNLYAPWMAWFSGWESKTLVTPNPRPYWGGVEQVIRQAGWTVIPASQEELAAVAHESLPDRADTGFVPGMFGSIAAAARRWLRRAAPPADEIEELTANLRISLGASGFYWLCACAAYPAIDWNVTLYLGRNLASGNGRPLLDEATFLALSRLPWFRHGRMPDWLRVALLGKLTRTEEEDVRAALQMLLNSAASGPLGTYRLEVDKDLRGTLSTLTRSVLRRLAKEAPPDSPIQDRVFVEFLSGRNPALAVPLPRQIRNAFQGRWLRSSTGEWLGHPAAVWQLIGLALLAEVAHQGEPYTGPNAIIGLAMLAAGFLAVRRWSIEKTVVAGVLILWSGSLVNVFTNQYVSYGLVQMGLGLLWPGIAVLLARHAGPQPGASLSALALWVATISLPTLIPALFLGGIWAKVLVVILIPLIVRSVPELQETFLASDTRFVGAAAAGGAILAAAAKITPDWFLPVILGIASLYAVVRLYPQIRTLERSMTFVAALLFSVISAAGINLVFGTLYFDSLVFNATVIATAVVLSVVWRQRVWANPNAGAFTLAFGCEWVGFDSAPTIASRAPLVGLIACGEALANSLGTHLAMRDMPTGSIGLAVALWWALRELGISIGQAPVDKTFAMYTNVAAFLAGMFVAWVSWKGKSSIASKPKVVAALCYFALVGWPFLLFRSYRRNTFVRFHAIQAFSFWLLFGLGQLPVIRVVSPFVDIVMVIVVPVLLIQAGRGKMTALPLIGRLARRFAYRITKPPGGGAADDGAGLPSIV